MKKFSQVLARQLEKLPVNKFSLADDGILTVSSTKGVAKSASGHLMLSADGSLNFHLKHSDYTKKYLKSTLKAAFADMGKLNFVDYLKVGEVVWIYPLKNFPNPKADDKLNLPSDTWYFRRNNSGPIACGEGIATLGQNFEAVFVAKREDVCDGGSRLTEFFEVRLNKVI